MNLLMSLTMGHCHNSDNGSKWFCSRFCFRRAHDVYVSVAV